MNRNKKEVKQELEQASKNYPNYLVELPKYEWGDSIGKRPVRVWRSRNFLVQEYEEKPGIVRLSVNRTAIAKGFGKKGGHNWKDGITWDELQKIKSQCGYGDKDAVEIFPKDKDVIHVANLRHLFVYLREEIDIAWRQ